MRLLNLSPSPSFHLPLNHVPPLALVLTCPFPAPTQAVTSRANDLETDLQMTRDELVRTGTVAARVAASEVKAGGCGVAYTNI